MKHLILAVSLAGALVGATFAQASAEEFADAVCPTATPLGRQLDRNLHETPVSAATVNKTESDLADVYAMCAGQYRMSGNIDGAHWASFREAKLRLLIGDYDLAAKHIASARANYQTAFDLANEIAKYEGGGLQVGGSNHVGSYSSSHSQNDHSQFRDIAAQLRDIAKKALADLPAQ